MTGSACLGGPLDGAEGDRDSAPRLLGPVGDLSLGVVAEPVVEPRNAVREELPGLSDLGAPVYRSERVSPPDPRAADHEGELPAGIRSHDLGARFPGPFGQFVAAGEPGSWLG